ncbi:endoribonuclease L-PSP [Bifidobacterium animalis subsp. animalis MCC 1489]|uniref:Translation initiation inhibitor n=1 Tax=Bifidobacterium animalis subsp. animalis IM386 TaxID=1402194 RepID=A0AAV2W334_9BIFI|nr:endoribonuclease L-PSP [Bifidobacterium animalis subsp. animalis MCC 1489]CDI68098.1 Translation initiation inhibitor [Bifidobacterium animalis subsp. animalis IM386]
MHTRGAKPEHRFTPASERNIMYENLQAVATTEAPSALGAYSQAVKANGFVFVSGQLGIDPSTGDLDGVTAASQAARALKNIKAILDAAGCGIEHVCRATIYLRNVEDFKEVDTEYAKVFTGTVKPARVAFGNNMIPKGALVEIDVIAVCPQN